MSSTSLSFKQYGQIPCLKDSDFQVVQSNAILRHLGRKHGLYGSNNREATIIDMINDSVEDGRTKFIRMIWQKSEPVNETYIINEIPKMHEQFQSLISANYGGKGFAVGEKVSFADYNLFDFLDFHLYISPACLDAYPVLKAYHERMINRPNIKAFRESDFHKNLDMTMIHWPGKK